MPATTTTTATTVRGPPQPQQTTQNDKQDKTRQDKTQNEQTTWSTTPPQAKNKMTDSSITPSHTYISSTDGFSHHVQEIHVIFITLRLECRCVTSTLTPLRAVSSLRRSYGRIPRLSIPGSRTPRSSHTKSICHGKARHGTANEEREKKETDRDDQRCDKGGAWASEQGQDMHGGGGVDRLPVASSIKKETCNRPGPQEPLGPTLNRGHPHP